MNVFAPSACPDQSARELCNRHVVKMALETAQILSTVAHAHDVPFAGRYRPTHRHHPCTVRCLDLDDYVRWTAAHGLALGREYTYRYGKRHRSAVVIASAIDALELDVEAPFSVADWPLAMPDEHKQPCPHASYRSYLARKYADWPRPAAWTVRQRPGWVG